MTDSGLALVNTSTGKQLGAIRLVNDKAVCDGLAEKVFRSRQRNAHEPLTDKQVYEWFAAGWSNGPLAVVPATGAEETASRGADDMALKRYWMTGEGAARWATWTELYDHLKKHMADEKARQIAASWFHERYGRWPGSDENRVAHGKPPRGDRVGPG